VPGVVELRLLPSVVLTCGCAALAGGCCPPWLDVPTPEGGPCLVVALDFTLFSMAHCRNTQLLPTGRGPNEKIAIQYPIVVIQLAHKYTNILS
jgi:hypothetical protein